MIALCLDPSLAATGFALMPIPLPADGEGYNPLRLIVLDGLAGEIENRNARETEQARLVRIYDELWRVVHLARARGHAIGVIAAEMAPNLYGGTAKAEKIIRFQFAAYTVIRLFAAHVRLPLLEVRPEVAKQVAVGYAKADKGMIKRGLAARIYGSMDARWPPGWTDNAIDALTVGYWLDALHAEHRRGGRNALSPHLPALAA
jgi:Holliday junction resolvasome RuvABC endonuclease subunit